MAAPRDPARVVADIYDLADCLERADKELANFWNSLSPDREADMESILGTYDFLMVGKKVRAYADAWQGQLDAVQS